MSIEIWKFLKLLTFGLSGLCIGTGIRYKLKAKRMREKEELEKELGVKLP